MALPAVSGNTIFASDLYQLCRPSGSQETGHYWLGGPVYTNGALISLYMPSQSRAATPVSASIDTADSAPAGGMNSAPTTFNLTVGGFQISTTSTTGPNTNAHCGGNYTIQY
ncbi:MAG TPA: hypothetical protein VFN23_07065 [Ktedonobacteraceae bacterium]|nr:hypothetical protein [Ktedonobacteraceae bacterium]